VKVAVQRRVGVGVDPRIDSACGRTKPVESVEGAWTHEADQAEEAYLRNGVVVEGAEAGAPEEPHRRSGRRGLDLLL
jgi:hypothetical protein